MSIQPTLKSSLLEHLKFARELRNLEIHYYPEKCKGVWQCYNGGLLDAGLREARGRFP
jgi:hypothetical protein